MFAEADDSAALGEGGTGEAGDEVDGAESGDKAGGDLLAEPAAGSRAECDSSRCFLPHGGRQMSWYGHKQLTQPAASAGGIGHKHAY